MILPLKAMMLGSLVLVQITAGPTALSQTPAKQTGLALTIYNDGLALVRDERSHAYTQGRSVVTFPGVSSQIQAPTVTFSATGVSIIEQNYDFDLLTPAKLMEKAVGKTVRIVRTNPATGRETTETAKVLSVNNGVVIEVDGRIEVLRDDNLPTRVIFDRVPENLRADPTLSVMVESNRAERKPTTLTYLTNGLGWRADYVALFDETAKQMDFQGWVTLSNLTETTFANAEVQMVAGDIAQSGSYERPRYPSRGISSVRSGGTEATPEARLGDNYLYPLPARTTVASNQTKQVGFVAADAVAAEKNYEFLAYGFDTMSEPQNADIRIAFSNAADKGLGAALPKGIVRVYTKDSEGRAQFIGEDRIVHTAGGADLSLKIGEAFDVTVQSAVRDRKFLSRKITETTMAYTLRNAKVEPVNITIRQQAGWWGSETEILDESLENRNPAEGQFVWDVPIPAEGETVLTFTLRATTR